MMYLSVIAFSIQWENFCACPSPELRKAIIDDISTGINAGQCACDLRNPQGSCCLGNVRGLSERVYKPAVENARSQLAISIYCR